MKKAELLWDYFFALKGQLNQKKYFIHYFLDLLLFVSLQFVHIGFFIVLGRSSLAQIKFFDFRLPIIILTISMFVTFAFLIMNRISVIFRRLDFLKMNKSYVLVMLVPLLGLLFDCYLLLKPDHSEEY